MLKYVLFTVLIIGQIHCADRFVASARKQRKIQEIDAHKRYDSPIASSIKPQWKELVDQYNFPTNTAPLRIWIDGESIHALNTDGRTVTYRIISPDDTVRVVGELPYADSDAKSAMLNPAAASQSANTVMADSYAEKLNHDLVIFAAGVGTALTIVAVTKTVAGKTCTIL